MPDRIFVGQTRVADPISSWTDGGTKHYTHLCTGSFYGASNEAIIIRTNIPGHNIAGNANMFSFKIVGYSYAGQGLIDMTIGMYAGENNYYAGYWAGSTQAGWIGKVWAYTDTSGKVCIQLGDLSTYQYCEIAVTDFVQGFVNVNTAYAENWSISSVSSLPTQNQKTALPAQAYHGNISFPTGYGIDFGENSSLGATPGYNTLDDYEEGTWTSANVATNLTQAPSSISGEYVKIGNIVHANFVMTGITAGTGSYYVVINGPFNQYDAGTQWVGYCNNYPRGTARSGLVVNNSSSNTTQWYVQWTNDSSQSNESVRGVITYRTA